MNRLLLAMIILAAGCNNDGADSNANATDSTTTEYRGVENVNGNIPDTMNTGAEPTTNYGLDSTDSSRKD